MNKTTIAISIVALLFFIVSVQYWYKLKGASLQIKSDAKTIKNQQDRISFLESKNQLTVKPTYNK